MITSVYCDVVSRRCHRIASFRRLALTQASSTDYIRQYRLGYQRQEEKEDAYQSKVDSVSKKGEKQSLCQIPTALSTVDDTGEFDRFVK